MNEFDLSAFLPYQLAVASARVSRDFAERYRAEFGLTLPEWRVLAHLSQTDAVSVREIHAQVEMDKSKISRAATRLETAGYVLKVEDKTDRRLVQISLTPKGKVLMDKLLPLANQFQEELLANLGPQADDLRAALSRLTAD
ncbi:MarR family winged helix-turn-helix transcriptional regulator [Actibacterium lipolyticum]|uniref:HTH-type transcriptional regulator SarZ n=1 Tax=Actibacterium lipolyticum TaxID=1524263 RepID=A0A238KVE8_9RHOB|nr:MarR family winged helix-turn-helix transcriptional regulator [Actibacterium lipolyticum]SMX46668.1 HTH-type transcriptional regulator SarZ [Actibacterium lipolyticum]